MMRYVVRTMDMGQGLRRHRVYEMPPVPGEYWPAVTDVACPAGCGGTVRWAEAGYVPGYRVCDGCGRHYQAMGARLQPTLVLMRGRS